MFKFQKKDTGVTSSNSTNTPRVFTLKRREKDRFHIVLTWNTRGVFVVNCVFMSSDVVLVTFFVNFGYISRLFLLFLLRIRLFHYILALNFSYRSQGTTIHCKSLTPRNKQNHIE